MTTPSSEHDVSLRLGHPNAHAPASMLILGIEHPKSPPPAGTSLLASITLDRGGITSAIWIRAHRHCGNRACAGAVQGSGTHQRHHHGRPSFKAHSAGQGHNGRSRHRVCIDLHGYVLGFASSNMRANDNLGEDAKRQSGVSLILFVAQVISCGCRRQ